MPALRSPARRVLRRLAAIAALSAIAPAAWPAPAAAVLTIVDGEASVIEGAKAMAATEGMRIADQALIETAPAARLVRVEWPDGTVADFAAGTRAMLTPSGFGQRDKRAPAFYLLRGWAKQSALGSASAAGQIALAAEVPAFKGVMVSLVSPAETWLFLESGSAQVIERQTKTATRQLLNPGEVYQRSGLDRGAIAPRPTPAQLQRVPRGFRDTLPLRAAAFKDKSAEGKPLAPPSYEVLRDWLTAEPALRRDFPRRFAVRLRDPAFRSAIDARLIEHPDWELLVHPERAKDAASSPRR